MWGSQKLNAMDVTSLFQSTVSLKNMDVTITHQMVPEPGIVVDSRHISQHKCTKSILVSLQENPWYKRSYVTELGGLSLDQKSQWRKVKAI